MLPDFKKSFFAKKKHDLTKDGLIFIHYYIKTQVSGLKFRKI